MKHARKLASLLLALTLVFALATTAFATGTNTITVQNAVKGQKYDLYKMLDLVVNEDKTAYSYTVNSAWADFFKAAEDGSPAGKGRDYVNIDEQGYVTWKTTEGGLIPPENVAAFAKDAEAFAKNKNLTALKTNTPTKDGAFTFSELDDGYYLVTSTLGTKAAVETTPKNTNAVIMEKNAAPSNVKTVAEGSTYGTENDASIGDTVNFKSTITAGVGAENYVLHDTMSAGLTFGSVTGITLNNTTVDTSKYTVVTTDLADGCTFEVRFTQAFCDSLKTNDKIVVSYTATLNENAVITGEGNSNTSKLSYGDSSNSSNTPVSTTTTHTWDFSVIKYSEKRYFTEEEHRSPEYTTLADAKFTLSKNAGGTSPIALVSEGNNVYRVAKTGETSTVTEITTDTTGRFTIKGLDSGTYYLTETKAPAGFNKLAGPVTIVIEADGKVKVDNNEVSLVEVQNQAGALLPSTGGMGTTIFYVLGSILAVGAIVLLVTKKRMSAAD